MGLLDWATSPTALWVPDVAIQNDSRLTREQEGCGEYLELLVFLVFLSIVVHFFSILSVLWCVGSLPVNVFVQFRYCIVSAQFRCCRLCLFSFGSSCWNSEFVFLLQRGGCGLVAKLIKLSCVVLQPCLVLLLDPFTMLGMCALLPLLEAIDTLVNYAQKRDVYICDFVAAFKVCQRDLYHMYEDKATCFSSDEF